MSTNEADLFRYPQHLIRIELDTKHKECQAINYAGVQCPWWILLKPEYCSGVCGCSVDKPVREKRIYLRDLQHIKRVVRGFVISNLMATLRGLCVQFREKLPSDCSLQPSGNIFGRKIPMSCSLKQQRKEEGGSTCGLLTHDEMSRRSQRHKVSVFVQQEGLRKIFLKLFFAASRSKL